MAHLLAAPKQVETGMGELSAGVEQRLAGIESEMREVRGFLERLVRVEERRAADAREIQELRSVATANQAQLAVAQVKADQLRLEMDSVLGRLEKIGETSGRSAKFVGGMERLGWIVVAALAAVWAAAIGSRFGGN